MIRIIEPAAIAAAIRTLRDRHGQQCKSRQNKEWRNHLLIFELVTAAGMTAADIAAIQIGEVDSRAIALYDRVVPIWCDALRHDLKVHMEYRDAANKSGDYYRSPLLASCRPKSLGKSLTRVQVCNWYRAACTHAGLPEGLRTINTGRQSFIAAAAAAGVPIDLVNLAMRSNDGWGSIPSMERYKHALYPDAIEAGKMPVMWSSYAW